MIDLLIAREAILLIAVAVSSYTDLKTGLIYDKITLPLIGIGIVLNLVEYVLYGYLPFLVAGLVFVLGYIAYYFGKIGGGDVKLFTGIALVLPFAGEAIAILPIIFYSAIAGAVFLSIFYLVKYARIGINLQENIQGIKNSLFLGAVVAIYFWFVYSNDLLKIQWIYAMAVPISFALLFLALEKGIRKNFFLKKVKLKELEEDELIALEFLDEKLKKKLELKGKALIGKKEKEKLKELGVKEILVYRNLPKFAPFILIGTIAVIAFPELSALFAL